MKSRKHVVHIMNGSRVIRALCGAVGRPLRYVALSDAHKATCPKCIKVAKDRK